MATKPLPPEFDRPQKNIANGSRELTRRDFVRIASVAGAASAVGAVAGLPAPAAAQPLKNALGAPVLSCFAAAENTITLKVCADAITGAPGGFSIQWMTCADYASHIDPLTGLEVVNTWRESDDPALCKASFSGNANRSNWNLAPGGCVTVVIGGLNDADPGVSYTCNAPLDCETCYVFRAFAHTSTNPKKNRSPFTTNLECTTGSCGTPDLLDGDFCTRSQGYYGSGNDSRDAMIACFGGDPTGATCTSTAGTPILTIGGGTYTYTWVTTGTCVDVQPGPGVFLMDSGLASLRAALGGGGTSGRLTANVTNPANMGSGGGLASQTAALTLNTGACGTSLCNGAGGAAYALLKLCNFVEGDTFKNDGAPISLATANALNTQTVGDVLAAANTYLGGGALPYGLASAADLNELVANLNLAFDLKDWDNDGDDDCACGGMTSFAASHLCR